MKVNYRGFEIDAHRDRSMCGDILLYYSIFREDGWELTSGFTYGSDRVQTFIKYLKERVDSFILNPEEESE